MDRLANLTPARLTDLAGRLFFDTVPTISAIGPLESLPSFEEIRNSLSTGRGGAASARAANA
jgi:hypothetical protein